MRSLLATLIPLLVIVCPADASAASLPLRIQQAPGLLWTLQAGSSDADQLHAIASDGAGGFFTFHAVGYGNQVSKITRRGPDGGEIWTNEVPLFPLEVTRAGFPTPDGGVITVSERRVWTSQFDNNFDILRRRYDDQGSLVWTYALATQEDDLLGGAVEDGQGGFYIGGISEPPLLSQPGVFLSRFDSDGAVQWIRSVQGLGGAEAMRMTRLADGTLFVAAVKAPGANNDPKELWFAQVSADGQTLWSNLFITELFPTLEAMEPTADGDALLVMTYYRDNSLGPISGVSDIGLRRITPSGSVVWGHLIGTDGFDRVLSVASTGAGGHVLAGVSDGSFTGAPAAAQDVFALKIDDLGQVQWSVGAGAAGNESNPVVVRDQRGGFFLGAETLGQVGQATFGGTDRFFQRYDASQLGRSECGPAALNSTGLSATITAFGSVFPADQRLLLTAHQMPPNSWGHFLGSRDAGFVPTAGGSQGTLCLGGSVSRFNLAGQIQQASPTGSFDLDVDVTGVPTVSGPVGIMAGETWRFQAWYRDANPGITSNFTDARAVLFE